jgi:hypothetical protein
MWWQIILSSRPVRWLLLAVGGVLTVLGLRVAWKAEGAQEARSEAEKEDLQDAVETHERIADADVSRGDADADRDYLRRRRPRGVLPSDGD